MAIMKEEDLCLICLKLGHQSCQQCQRQYHTLLHECFGANTHTKVTSRSNQSKVHLHVQSAVMHSSPMLDLHLSHPNSDRHRHVLLMACQILVATSDGHVMQALSSTWLHQPHLLHNVWHSDYDYHGGTSTSRLQVLLV